MSRRFLLPKTVVVQEVGDASILLDLESGVYFELNQTGSQTLSLIRDGYDLQQIHRQLALDFEIDDARLSADLDKLLADLLAEGLIVEQD